MSQTLHLQLARRRGLGFVPQSFFDSGGENLYDSYFEPDLPYYTDYGSYDFWGGGDYTTPGISPYSFDQNDLQQTLDWWSNLSAGTGVGYDPNSLYSDPNAYIDENGVLHIGSYSDQYGDLNQTLDWWNNITTTSEPSVVWPDVDNIDWDWVLYDPGIVLPTGINLPPVYDPPPPKTAPKADKTAWLKKLAENALKRASSSGGAAGGSAGGSRPATTQPNAQGQCQQGYQLNAAKTQCVLIPTKPATDLLTTLKENPLYLLLGAIALILLAKK